MSSKDKTPCKVAAAAALDALHAALTHEVHCQYFLQGKHELHMDNLMKAAAQPIDSDLSMYAVIDNMEGCLPAQLTAVSERDSAERGAWQANLHRSYGALLLESTEWGLVWRHRQSHAPCHPGDTACSAWHATFVL